MSAKPSISDCHGCRDDVYNRQSFGANVTPEGPRCWSLEKARFVSARDIPLSMRPPFDRVAPTTRPNCYRAPGFVRMPVPSRKP